MFRMLILILTTSLIPVTGLAAVKRPRLAVVLVIDQFRADYLLRFESKFLPEMAPQGSVGGFRYLMQKGAYFPYAEHSTLQNMTCPGHAEILSGALPYQNGIPSNHWYDSTAQREVYCVEDQNSPLVTSSLKSDPKGRSPRNFIGTTVGDEMKNAGYSGRVIALALKDRAAILLGGHRADSAFWFNSESRQWTSSKYYIPDGKLPGWIQSLNQETLPKTGSLDTSFGLELTEQAAEKAVLELGLKSRTGQTDLLAISFSSHDYAGHQFGPNSSEMEDMTIAEDRLISRFLNFLKKQNPKGLEDIVIVLTGDHGIPPHPDWLRLKKIPTGQISERDLAKKVSVSLSERYGKPTDGDWISYQTDLNFHLNRKAITEKGLDKSKIEAEAKAVLIRTPGIAQAFTYSDYLNRKLPPGIHEKQILNTYFPGRSGDIILIPQPFFMASEDDSKSVTHMTGYTYDRMVPLIFSGQGIKPGVYLNPTQIIDIAPTLSWLLGVIPPSLSEGRVLTEALRDAGATQH